MRLPGLCNVLRLRRFSQRCKSMFTPGDHLILFLEADTQDAAGRMIDQWVRLSKMLAHRSGKLSLDHPIDTNQQFYRILGTDHFVEHGLESRIRHFIEM